MCSPLSSVPALRILRDWSCCSGRGGGIIRETAGFAALVGARGVVLLGFDFGAGGPAGGGRCAWTCVADGGAGDWFCSGGDCGRGHDHVVDGARAIHGPGLVVTVEILGEGVSFGCWSWSNWDRTEESEMVSSAVGMLNPLMAVGVPKGSMKRSFESGLVRLSPKSKETGSMSAGFREKRSIALS